MVFNIKSNGLILKISSDNKLCFQIKESNISDEIKFKYQHLLKNDVIRFTYPYDESWVPQNDIGTNLSVKENVKSVEISKKTMVRALNSLRKTDIIYTGAGISRAAGIMTSEELYNVLCINNNYDAMVEAFVNNTNYILAQFRMFSMRLLHSYPTEAHLRIAELVKEKACKLVSENLDNLHEKTGVRAIYASDNMEKLMDMKPDRVFLLGIGKPMCTRLFDRWYERGTEFYAINSTYTELSVPTDIYIGDVQEFFGYEK